MPARVRYEIANLPAQFFPVAGMRDPAAARAKSQACAAQMAREDFGSSTQRELLVARAQVPDNYSSLKRVLGLYPLAIIPFSKGVEGWHKEATEMFAKAAAEPTPATGVVRYEAAAKSVTAEQVVGHLLAPERGRAWNTAIYRCGARLAVRGVRARISRSRPRANTTGSARLRGARAARLQSIQPGRSPIDASHLRAITRKRWCSSCIRSGFPSAPPAARPIFSRAGWTASYSG